MSKHTDTAIEGAETTEKRLLEFPEPPHTSRLRKIPATVDDHGLAIIRRAVCLQLAQLGSLEPESAEATGRSIVTICSTWLVHETVDRKGQP